MQGRFRERTLDAKKKFLREIVKEVRVRNTTIQLTYKLPLAPSNSPSESKTARGEFFTLGNVVDAVGQCKELVCAISFRLPHPARKTRPRTAR